jgi:hypothetical protein
MRTQIKTSNSNIPLSQFLLANSIVGKFEYKTIEARFIQNIAGGNFYTENQCLLRKINSDFPITGSKNLDVENIDTRYDVHIG